MKRWSWALVVVALVGCGSVHEQQQPDAAVVACNGGCDDGFECTDDTCVNDACQFTPHDDRCNNGYGCDIGAGCVPRYGKSQARPGTSCADILSVLVTASDGVYWIDPDGGAADNSFEVYCDMTTDGGGWTLVYKYVGNDTHSQNEILDAAFAGTTDTKAPLATERADAIHRRAYDAFWTAHGKSWMSKWMLYDGSDNHEIDHNFAVFDLANGVSWNDVYGAPQGCSALGGTVTLKVYDEATNTLVTVGSSSERYATSTSTNTGVGFLAADTTQLAYDNTCSQAAGNYITWPAGLKFDVTLNLDWASVIPHLWYARELTNRDKDRCSWFCWVSELTYSGREWYVR